MKHNLYIQGATGKMGKLIASYANNYHITKDIIDAKLIIDFSHVDSIDYFLQLNLKNKAILCGSTGASNLEQYFAKLHELSKNNAVFYSSNMSKGIFILSEIIKFYLQFNANIDPLIIDVHHMQKKDFPSGTAKFLASFFNNPTHKSIKEGDEVGTHSLVFEDEFEELTFSHKAKDRSVFAISALKISAWLLQQKNGFYQMQDYFKLN